MSDLYDAVEDEIRAYTPGVAPPFALLADRKRRAHRRVALGAGAVALAAVSASAVVAPRLLSDDEALQPSVPSTAPAPAAPDVLVIDCQAAGPVLPGGTRVAAQADGVHFTFRNQTSVAMHWAFALGGGAVSAGAAMGGTASRAAPGRDWTVSCSDDVETLKEHEVAVSIEDPRAVFVPVPECSGRTSITDFVQPLKGDPVELTLRSHDRADVVGYPQGQPRLVYTGNQLISWEGEGDAWMPSQTTSCGAAAPHVLGAGIKAPPPTQLTHTDEFGLVRAVRKGGDGIEVDVDRVDMLGGAEAEAAAAAAGTEVSNDYFLRNDNPTLRTYRISPNAVVWGSIRMRLPEPWPKRTTLARWQEFVATSAAAGTLFHFEVSDGIITGIEEQYRP